MRIKQVITACRCKSKIRVGYSYFLAGKQESGKITCSNLGEGMGGGEGGRGERSARESRRYKPARMHSASL